MEHGLLGKHDSRLQRKVQWLWYGRSVLFVNQQEFVRVGVKFSREGMTNFVSHLDMQRIFARALRRTGLEVKYSQGFNPHIVTSFAQALSVGMSTRGDYFEFFAKSIPQNIVSLLNEELPREIRVLAGGIIPQKSPKLMAAVCMAEYVFFPTQNAEEYFSCINKILNSESYVATRKKDGKQIEIRPLIISATLTPEFARMKLSLTQNATLTPNVLRDVIDEIAGESIPANVMRMDLYYNNNAEISPLQVMFENGAK